MRAGLLGWPSRAPPRPLPDQHADFDQLAAANQIELESPSHYIRRPERVGQVADVLDRPPAQLDDDVAHQESRRRGGPVDLDREDHQATVALDSEPLLGLWVEAHRLHRRAEPAT